MTRIPKTNYKVTRLSVERLIKVSISFYETKTTKCIMYRSKKKSLKTKNVYIGKVQYKFKKKENSLHISVSTVRVVKTCSIDENANN